VGAVLIRLFYQAMQVQVRLAVTLKIIVKLRLASHMGVSVVEWYLYPACCEAVLSLWPCWSERK